MTDDWFDLLSAFAAGDVRFLVVGAHALAAHGVPRGTQDLDVWVEPSPENAQRVWAALAAFGAPLDALGVTLDDLQRADTVVQLGLPPDRIDLLTALTGVAAFEHAWRDRVEHVVRDLRVPFLGRATLLANKRATGRRKDLADVEALGEDPDAPGANDGGSPQTSTTAEMIARLRALPRPPVVESRDLEEQPPERPAAEPRS